MADGNAEDFIIELLDGLIDERTDLLDVGCGVLNVRFEQAELAGPWTSDTRTGLQPGQPHVDEVMGDITDLPGLRRLVRRIAVGNGGAGGQAVFADPAVHLTGAFVRSAMSTDPTAEKLIDALFDCLVR